MVHSPFPRRFKGDDQTPILVNDSVEESVLASENIQYEGENIISTDYLGKYFTLYKKVLIFISCL